MPAVCKPSLLGELSSHKGVRSKLADVSAKVRPVHARGTLTSVTVLFHLSKGRSVCRWSADEGGRQLHPKQCHLDY